MSSSFILPWCSLHDTRPRSRAGRRLDTPGGVSLDWVGVPSVGFSFVASCAVFLRVWRGETFRGDLFPWIEAGAFKTAVTALVDPLSAVMLLVVTGVGFLIHLYSVGYMHGDPGYARFFTYLN